MVHSVDLPGVVSGTAFTFCDPDFDFCPGHFMNGVCTPDGIVNFWVHGVTSLGPTLLYWRFIPQDGDYREGLLFAISRSVVDSHSVNHPGIYEGLLTIAEMHAIASHVVRIALYPGGGFRARFVKGSHESVESPPEYGVFDAQVGDHPNYCFNCGAKLKHGSNVPTGRPLSNWEQGQTRIKNKNKKGRDLAIQESGSSNLIPFDDEVDEPIGQFDRHIYTSPPRARTLVRTPVRDSPSQKLSQTSTISQRDSCLDAVFDAVKDLTKDGSFGDEAKSLRKEDLEEIWEAQVGALDAQVGGLFNFNVTHDVGDYIMDIVDDVKGAIRDLGSRIPTVDSMSGAITAGALNVWDRFGSMFKQIPIVLLYCYAIMRLWYYEHMWIRCIKRRGSAAEREALAKPKRRWGAVAVVCMMIYLWMIRDSMREGLTPIVTYIYKKYTCVQVTHPDPVDPDEFLGSPDEGVDMFDAQLGADTSINKDIGTMLLTALSFGVVNQAPSGRKLEKFLSLVSLIPRASDGMSKIMESLVDLVLKGVNFIRCEMLGYGPYLWFDQMAPDVDKWCHKVQALYDESKTPAWVVNQTNCVRLEETLKEGNSLFLGKYSNALESNRVRSALSTYMGVLKKLLVPFEQANIAGVAPRMRPITIFLGGETGVGKSNVSIPLLTAVLAKVLPENQLKELQSNYMDFIYNRQAEQNFWDRYYGQMCCVFDDFMQKRDNASDKDGEIMDIIRCTNMFPNVLHMAALENKGTTVFTSRIILATVNTFKLNVQSITHTPALTSRFNYVYRVVPARKYCTRETRSLPADKRRLDTKHPDLVNCPFVKDVYEFHRMKWTDKNEAVYDGQVLTFDGFVDHLAKEYKIESARSEKYNGLVKENLDEFVRRRAEERMEAQSLGDMEPADTPSAEDVGTMVAMLENTGQAGPSTVKSMRLGTVRKEAAPEKVKVFFGLVMDDLRKTGMDDLDISEFTHQLRKSHTWLNAMRSSHILWLLRMTCPDLWADILDECSKVDEPGLHAWTIASDLVSSEHWDSIVFEMVSNDLRVNPSVGDFEGSMLVRAKKSLTSFFEAVREKGSNFIREHPLVSLLGLFGFVFGAYKIGSALISVFKSQKEDSFEVEGPSGTLGRGRKNKKAQHKSARVFHHVTPQELGEYDWLGQCDESKWTAQGGGDLNAIQMAKRLIQKSSYAIYVPWSERRIGSLVFIRGRIALVPYHYVKYFRAKMREGDCDGDTEVVIRNDWKKVGYRIKVSEFCAIKENSALEERDLCTFLAPHAVHQHPDITKCFIEHHVLDKPLDLTVHCMILESDGGWRLDTGIAVAKKDFKVHKDGEMWAVVKGYMYSFPTLPGDCGSMVLLNNKAVGPGKIIGMHIGGNGSSVGVASAVDRELIEHAISQYATHERICPPDEVTLEPQLLEAPYESNQLVLRKVDRGISTGSKSKILRSALYECLGPALTKPAHLCPYMGPAGVLIDPRKIGLADYCRNNKRVDPTILQACVDNLISKFVRLAGDVGWKPKLLTFDQAVAGDPALEFCDGLDRKTSPGYPFVHMRKIGYPGKTWWFGRDGPYDLDNPLVSVLRERVTQIIEEARVGNRLFHVFMDVPKDERRPIAKVDAGKTRCISGSPMDYTIAMRIMFLDFARFLMVHRIRSGVCIGINARSSEWNVLVKALKRFDKTLAGDYSGFDKGILAEILMEFARLANTWYDDGPENALARITLMADCANSIHLFEDVLMYWIGSLPSGLALTGIIDCFVQMVHKRIGFVLCHPAGLHGLQFYEDHVEEQVYGDDGVFSFSDAVSSFFNQLTLTDALETIGQIYTDETKEIGGAARPWRTIEEVTFLKRGFRWCNELARYCAPLELDTIKEMIYWTRDTAGPEEITRTNVETALVELSLHGPEVYSEVSAKVIAACRQRLEWIPAVTSYRANLLASESLQETW